MRWTILDYVAKMDIMFCHSTSHQPLLFLSSHNLLMCPRTVSVFHITSRTTVGPTITAAAITAILATIQERVTIGFTTPLATTRTIGEAVVAWLRMTSSWSASRSVCVVKFRAQTPLNRKSVINLAIGGVIMAHHGTTL